MDKHIQSFFNQDKSWDLKIAIKDCLIDRSLSFREKRAILSFLCQLEECSYYINSFISVVVNLSKELELDPSLVFDKMANELD
jgi:hypothetical protein